LRRSFSPPSAWPRSGAARPGSSWCCARGRRRAAYFTDASALAPAYGRPPTVICGPGDADQCHRTDESCSVSKLETAADAYFEIARRWCGL
jgi:succinyl-diaminopimelate desuccinylase